MQKKRIEKLFLHPIKSCKGVEVTTLDIGPLGPRHDREYIVVDMNTMKFLSQAGLSEALPGFQFAWTSAGFLSSSKEKKAWAGRTCISRTGGGKQHTVRSHNEECKALWAGSPAADQLFSQLLGIDCKLMKVDPLSRASGR